MPSTKPASRQANYRSRTHLKSMATLLGWRLMDVAGVFETGTGTYVIVEHDGSRVELPPVEAVTSPTPNGPTRTRKLTVPKSWVPETWNDNRAAIIKQSMTKEEVVSSLTAMSEKTSDPGAEKRLKQAVAVIEACPDTPDWYDYLPVAEVTDDE